MLVADQHQYQTYCQSLLGMTQILAGSHLKFTNSKTLLELNYHIPQPLMLLPFSFV